MSKRKKIILCLVTAAVVLAVGATVAYLAAVTGTKTNKFSSTKYLGIQLREPSWDGYGFDEKNSKGVDPTGDEAKENSTDSSLGVNASKRYIPGADINKDPQVKNTGITGKAAADAVDAYVAIKVVYTVNGSVVSYQDFKNQLLDSDGINFSDKWTNIAEEAGTNPYQVYMYGPNTNSPISISYDTTTTPLFTTVSTSPNITLIERTVDEVKTYLPPSFDIKVQAFAIQSANVTADQAASQLLSLISATGN